MSSALTSNSLRMMERSMEFLWAKQTAHLDNIANAETPGYKVKTVRFEEEFDRKLRAAADLADIDGGRNVRRRIRNVIEGDMWSVDEDEEFVRMDENGVNATEQLLETVRSAYQLQYVYRAISSDLTTLGKAING